MRQQTDLLRNHVLGSLISRGNCRPCNKGPNLLTAKTWGDQLVAVGKPIDDEDLISLIISGLNPIFSTFVITFSLSTRNTSLSFHDFQDELLNHELMLNQQQVVARDSCIFALYAQRSNSRNFPSRKKKVPQGKSPSQFTKSRHFNFFTQPMGAFQPRPRALQPVVYQISAIQLVYSVKSVGNQITRHQTANAHITNALENLQIQQPFESSDTVAVWNGMGLA